MDKLVFFNDNQNVLINQVEITAVDLGTVGLASSDDTRLRIYNPSDTYQADDVVVSSENADMLLLSLDGDTFGPTAELGDLPPQGISDTFVMRRITASTANYGVLVTARLSAEPGAWVPPIDTSPSDNIPLPEGADADDDSGPVDDRPTDPDFDDD